MTLEPHNEAQVRAGALAHAMQTATAGEDVVAILTRAHLYLQFVLKPFEVAGQSEQMGAPPTKALN